MIDIFAPIKPDIYIADISVEYLVLLPNGKIHQKDKDKKPYTVSMERVPILLLNGKLPTKNYERKILMRFYKKANIKEDFNRIMFREIKIVNAKFSSKIQRHFDITKD